MCAGRRGDDSVEVADAHHDEARYTSVEIEDYHREEDRQGTTVRKLGYDADWSV